MIVCRVKLTDSELLRSYAEDGSEAAFTELVKRHVDLVYGTAMRQAWGDATLAEDLTQSVFTAMARKAGELSKHPVPSGWLYKYVRYLAANHHRADQRRINREQASIKMDTPNSSDDGDSLWEEVKPVLDDAMDGLNDQDRNAVVLRFYQDQSLREVGAALGLSENAARMRVARALTKLRDLLAQRGVSSSSTGLAAALVAGATFSAPAGMAATVATNALAATACATTTTTAATVTTIMSMTKVKAGLAAVVVTAGLGVTALQESRVRQLSRENAALQTKVAELPSLRAQNERLKGAIAASDSDEEQGKTELEIAGLRGRLTLAMARIRELETPPPIDAADPKPQAKPETAAEAPKMTALMRAGVRVAIERETLGKLPRLTERLGLSPEQEQAAQRIMQRGFDARLALTTNMLAGNLTPEWILKNKALALDPMKEIQALLTPEQKVAYEEHKQEEKVATARVAANGELLEMQQASLALSQEQQDQVYDALYQLRMGPRTIPRSAPADQSGSKDQWWFVDRKVDALKEVLTPAQLEQYRQMLEQKRKLMNSIMPKLKP